MEKSAGRERVVMVRRTSSKELCLISCGYEIGTKNQSFGPSVRDCYMIHFVTEGEGHYYLNHKHYRIRKGQCFLTVPGVSTLYHAEPENPWVYMWVCVSGSLAPRLLEQCRMNAGMPVLELPDMKKITNIIEEMMRHDELSPVDECTIQGSLYLLFAALLEQQRAAYSQTEQSDNRYVTKAVDFIGEHISGELLVEDVAEYLNVSRGHLYELFRRELGVSPQQFLTNARLANARKLLTENDLSIAETAALSGYKNAFAFSRAFKQANGMSPRDFKKTYGAAIIL